MGQKYSKVKATYLLWSYQQPKLEGCTVTRRPRPAADLLVAVRPGPRGTAGSLPANPVPRRPSELGLHTFKSCVESTWRSSAGHRALRTARTEAGRTAAVASALPGWERRSTPVPSGCGDLPTRTSRAGAPCFRRGPRPNGGVELTVPRRGPSRLGLSSGSLTQPACADHTDGRRAARRPRCARAGQPSPAPGSPRPPPPLTSAAAAPAVAPATGGTFPAR